jgi:preprotein translocase subunit SecG
MSYIAGLLTFLLVINCLLLILLILMQLPKKDAGAGVAFGGAAADALFGAGSGNFLTQTTRYATIVLFALALLLGYVESHLNAGSSASEFEKAVQQKQAQPPIPTQQPIVPTTTQPVASNMNDLLPLPVVPSVAAPTSTPASAPVSEPAAPPLNKPVAPPTSTPVSKATVPSNAPAKPTQAK